MFNIFNFLIIHIAIYFNGNHIEEIIWDEFKKENEPIMDF
jgi:hypothetical protein